MCLGIVQPFILHITCMRFPATLAKPKFVGNPFTYLNLLLRTKHLYDCYAKQWLVHFSRYCTSHLLSLIKQNLSFQQSLLFSIEVMFFSSFICLFLKSNIFCFFFISMLQMNNLFFSFKNKNCRVYHECTF